MIMKILDSKMNKRQIIASLNKIANELDNNNLFNEANSLTNVMRRLSQTEEAERQDPFSLSHNETNDLYDDEYDKKMFIASVRNKVWTFVNYVEGSLREKGFNQNPNVWKTILEMIALNYSPDMLNNNNQKALDVLNEVWSKYEELGKETVKQANFDEELSAKYGIPTASDEQNRTMGEQYSTLTGMVLIALKQRMRESVRMNADYMSSKDIVNDHIEPAYTTKYNPDNIEKQ